MGLQELDHLKKTLRKIGEKKIRISEIESDLVNLKDEKKLTALVLNRKVKSLQNAKIRLKKKMEEIAKDRNPLNQILEKIDHIDERIEAQIKSDQRGFVFIRIIATVYVLAWVALIVFSESVRENQTWMGLNNWSLLILLGCPALIIFPLYTSLREAQDPKTFPNTRRGKLFYREKQDLIDKKSFYEREQAKGKSRERAIKNLENEILSEEVALSKYEASIIKNEAELQVLPGEIEEHYESIKHLIPFGHKLESDQ